MALDESLFYSQALYKICVCPATISFVCMLDSVSNNILGGWGGVCHLEELSMSLDIFDMTSENQLIKRAYIG